MMKNSFIRLIEHSINVLGNRSINLKKKILTNDEESCYIIGNGISIKWFDLFKFSNLNSILINYSLFHKDVKKLNIIANICIEPLFFYPFHKFPRNNGKIMRNSIQSEYRKFIINNPEITSIVHFTNWPTTWRYNNIYYNTKNFTFMDNQHYLFNIFDCFGGSFRFSISLAIYLGFKNIYLIGFDYTHSPSRVLHWYEKGTGIIQKNDDYDKDFILAAKEYANIITITLDGKSKHLDYITYKDFTGEDPAYRENTEIVSQEYLKTLSSWPGNTIY